MVKHCPQPDSEWPFTNPTYLNVRYRFFACQTMRYVNSAYTLNSGTPTNPAFFTTIYPEHILLSFTMWISRSRRQRRCHLA